MPTEPGRLLKHIRLRSATALVVANIVGAGIFTTTGFQSADLGHPGLIFLLWLVGGLLALSGALCYAELGAAIPEAGGEYAYLREAYGPLLAFMSAFVSLVAGFSAPIAAALKSFAAYATLFFPFLDSNSQTTLSPANIVAIILTWLLVAVHLRGMRGGTAFNDLVTLLKVTGIVAIILAAAAIGKGDVANFTQVAPVYNDLSTTGTLAAMGTSLIFVSFCYLGWNASAYVAAEMNNPQRDLPRSLLLGTGIVIVLYLGLNAVYFYGAPASELAGEVEVGLIAARGLFGPIGITLVTLILMVSIFASASAMTLAGPRVYYAFGRDVPPLRILAATSPKTGAPTTALLLQGAVTTALILSGRVDQIQQYAGFTLTLFSSLAVVALIVLRIKRPDMPRPFKTWGYPATPIFFLAVAIWTMVWAFMGRPLESSLGLATITAAGALFYAFARKVNA